jgi:hypothetical protein
MFPGLCVVRVNGLFAFFFTHHYVTAARVIAPHRRSSSARL